VPLHLWTLTTPLLHNRVEPEVVHTVGATARSDNPAAVYVNPLDVDPSFSEVTVGFRLNGFAGHNERHLGEDQRLGCFDGHGGGHERPDGDRDERDGIVRFEVLGCFTDRLFR